MQFSANLGFLWSDLYLPDAIRAAAAAGFDAVECHFPYSVPVEETRAALDDTGLPLLGLNTIRGSHGDNGLAALPGREAEARRAIDEAIAYADAVGAQSIHVMAGRSEGIAAEATFLENLRYARESCPDTISLLIEPLNRHDAPGYFLKTTDQAATLLKQLDHPGVKLMFDCYHVGRTEGDLVTRLRQHIGIIGHIQFAAVPDRGPPDHGEIEFGHVFREVTELGWSRPLGAEYRVAGPTEESLEWMSRFKT